MNRLLTISLISLGFIGIFSSCDKEDDTALSPTVAYVTSPSDTTVNAEAHIFKIDVTLPGNFKKDFSESWTINRPAFYDSSVPADEDPWYTADVNPLGGWIEYGRMLWAQEIPYKNGAFIWVKIQPNKTGKLRAIKLPISNDDKHCWYIGQCIIRQLPEQE